MQWAKCKSRSDNSHSPNTQDIISAAKYYLCLVFHFLSVLLSFPRSNKRSNRVQAHSGIKIFTSTCLCFNGLLFAYLTSTCPTLNHRRLLCWCNEAISFRRYTYKPPEITCFDPPILFHFAWYALWRVCLTLSPTTIERAHGNLCNGDLKRFIVSCFLLSLKVGQQQKNRILIPNSYFDRKNVITFSIVSFVCVYTIWLKLIHLTKK